MNPGMQDIEVIAFSGFCRFSVKKRGCLNIVSEKVCSRFLVTVCFFVLGSKYEVGGSIERKGRGLRGSSPRVGHGGGDFQEVSG